MEPDLVIPLDEYEQLGTFAVERSMSVGETSLDTTIAAKPGRWRVWYLDADRSDDLADQGAVGEEGCEQVVLIHEATPLPTSVALPPLQRLASVPIEGARFTIACTSFATVLAGDGDDAFYDHLDGVHGMLETGVGVTLMLGGDGTAEIWSSKTADFIFVRLG